MNISVREFLDYSYNNKYKKIINNKTEKILWEGEFETIDHHIPIQIQKLNVVKWGIENNGIVIYVNY